jgi:hypothetical protein
MKKDKLEMTDDLRDEYDLSNLRVRRLGSERKSFGGLTVKLESDVAEIFSSAEAVNEALRFMIKVMKQNQISTVIEQSTLEPVDEISPGKA